MQNLVINSRIKNININKIFVMRKKLWTLYRLFSSKTYTMWGSKEIFSFIDVYCAKSLKWSKKLKIKWIYWNFTQTEIKQATCDKYRLDYFRIYQQIGKNSDDKNFLLTFSPRRNYFLFAFRELRERISLRTFSFWLVIVQSRAVSITLNVNIDLISTDWRRESKSWWSVVIKYWIYMQMSLLAAAHTLSPYHAIHCCCFFRIILQIKCSSWSIFVTQFHKKFHASNSDEKFTQWPESVLKFDVFNVLVHGKAFKTYLNKQTSAETNNVKARDESETI